MKVISILLIIVSIGLVGFIPLEDSLIKKNQQQKFKTPFKKLLKIDSLNQSSLKLLAEGFNKSNFSSKMPIKQPEGNHFIRIAVPDTTINYHLRIKNLP